MADNCADTGMDHKINISKMKYKKEKLRQTTVETVQSKNQQRLIKEEIEDFLKQSLSFKKRESVRNQNCFN